MNVTDDGDSRHPWYLAVRTRRQAFWATVVIFTVTVMDLSILVSMYPIIFPVSRVGMWIAAFAAPFSGVQFLATYVFFARNHLDAIEWRDVKRPPFSFSLSKRGILILAAWSLVAFGVAAVLLISLIADELAGIISPEFWIALSIILIFAGIAPLIVLLKNRSGRSVE